MAVATTYVPTQWKAGDTVTSVKLNKIEQGIANNAIAVASGSSSAARVVALQVNNYDSVIEVEGPNLPQVYTLGMSAADIEAAYSSDDPPVIMLLQGTSMIGSSNETIVNFNVLFLNEFVATKPGGADKATCTFSNGFTNQTYESFSYTDDMWTQATQN